MSKYIPKLARELIDLMKARGFECLYNHDNQWVEVIRGAYTIRPTLRFIEDRTPILTADIISSEFIDFKKEQNDE